MANKYPSVPPKTLAVDLSSAGTTLKLTDIEDWGGVDLTTTSFASTYIPATLINDSGTRVEFILITASTIGSATTTGATIFKRGLKYYATGDIVDNQTEVTANKLEWTQGETKVLLGTHTPYLFGTFANKENDENIEGAWDYDEFPTKNGTLVPTAPAEFATKSYVDGGGGAASYNAQVISGTAGETLAINDVVYFKESDQRWWFADADAFATASNIKFGIAASAATAGVTVNITTDGIVTTLTGLTPGAKYYLSGTAGALSVTPGANAVFLGWAQTATNFIFAANGLPAGLIWGTAGENLAVGEAVYLKSSDTKWWKTDADASATSQNVNIAMVQATAVTDGVCILRERGVDNTNTGLTVGSIYYLSGTAGAITASAPTILRVVGKAIATNLLDLNYNPTTVSQNGAEIYAIDSSVAADTITVALVPALVGYYQGLTLRIKVANTNTTAVNVNVNGLGNVALKKQISAALVAGDVAVGQEIVIIHDGTNFQLVTPTANTLSFTPAWKQGIATQGASTGTNTVAHGLGRVPSYVRVTAVADGATAQVSESVCSAQAASGERGVYWGTDGATATIAGTVSDNIIQLNETGAGSPTVAAELQTVDATNIVLNFTTASIGCSFFWEVYG